MAEEEHGRPSLLSLITFSWLNPFIQKGRKGNITVADLQEVALKHKSAETAKRFTENWARHRKKQVTSGRISNMRTLCHTVYEFLSASIVLGGLMQLAYLLTLLIPPVLMSLFVDLLAQSNDANYYTKGLTMCFGMSLCLLTNTVLASQTIWISDSAGLEMRTGLVAAIYQQALQLSGASRHRFPVSKVIQLVAADVPKIDAAWEYLHFTWGGPLQIAFSFFMLYRLLGGIAVYGAAIIFAFIPMHVFIVHILARNRKQLIKTTDLRVCLLQEIIIGIRVLKYYSWEDVFAAKMALLRSEELEKVRRIRTISALSHPLTWTIPIFASVVSFLAFAWSGEELTASVVFPALAYFNTLQRPLMIMPTAASNCIEGIQAMKRIKRFLEAPICRAELAIEPDLPHAILVEQAGFEWDAAQSTPSGVPPPTIVPDLSLQEIEAEPAGVYPMRGASTTPISMASPFSGIHDLTLAIPRGSLVAIVGPVGSGKSSLLAAMMGEMTRTSGSIRLGGTIAYCPQQSWIQNATVKDNILFGRPFDQDRYDAVIEQCALTADLQLLSHGDMTEIGERGINLSGGQRLRVNLARAAYYDADILILDDPLSAVDAHVGRTIFEECICGGLMAGKTRILVTHHLHVLTQVDLILVMQSGQLVQRGTFDELFRSATPFSDLLRQYTGGRDEEGDGIPLKQITPNEPKEKKLAKDVEAKSHAAEDYRVSPHVYYTFANATQRAGLFISLAIFTVLLCELNRVVRNVWLSFWTRKRFGLSQNTYMTIYAVCGVMQTFTAWLSALVFVIAGYYAARNLHEGALHRVMRAPLWFFDATPVGRIISRFSKDQGMLDSFVSETLYWLLVCFGYIVMAIVEISYASLWNLCFLLPTLIAGFILQSIFGTTCRQLQRFQTKSLAPLMSNFSETYAGLTVIRAFRVEPMYTALHHSIVDGVNRCNLLSMALPRWVVMRSGCLGALLVLLVLLYYLLYSGDAKVAGFAISAALDISASLEWCMRQFSRTEASMIAVERIAEYAEELESEAPQITDVKTDDLWPAQGRIEFKDVYLSYRPSLPPVLSGISVAIEPRQKVAIVGRTGAGKSTILLALFCIIELSSGQILIDGVDISKIGLKDLRSRLAIVPQEPVLFSGTLRFNLDPRGAHTDAEIWLVLERTYMREHVAKQEGGLDSAVLLNGENYSVGQRQLLCLTRALLRQSKVIVMDEATASIDLQTDALIQTSLRLNFAAFTLITIAHRINTILDYDRILVLDGGRVVEFGEPQELLADENSAFASLVVASGANK